MKVRKKSGKKSRKTTITVNLPRGPVFEFFEQVSDVAGVSIEDILGIVLAIGVVREIRALPMAKRDAMLAAPPGKVR